MKKSVLILMAVLVMLGTASADNLKVNNTKVVRYGIVDIPIELENYTEYASFQFDIVLPNGLYLYDIVKGDRFSDEMQDVSFGSIGYNTYRVASVSTSNRPFIGTNGTLLILRIGSYDSIGEQTVTLNNILFSNTNAVGTKFADVSFVVTVEDERDHIPGDANDDGAVNAADIVEIVNYIMDNPSERFVYELADMNGDGYVNAGDIVSIVNAIMYEPLNNSEVTR